MSRLFTQFQNHGILSVNRRELHILDKAALQAMAEEDGDEQQPMRKAG